MPRSVAVAVVGDDAPEVFVAEDQDTLNWAGVDVYPSFELYTERDGEMAARGLEFTPLSSSVSVDGFVADGQVLGKTFDAWVSCGGTASRVDH